MQGMYGYGIEKCLAANIRRLRCQKGMTQAELAAKAKISLIFLQGIETERKWVSPRSARAIARALRVSEACLFEDCFKDIEPARRAPKRLPRQNFAHVPTDVYNGLATLCREDKWRWDAFRWILRGFESDLSINPLYRR